MAKMALTEDVKSVASGSSPVPGGVRDLEVRDVREEVVSQAGNHMCNVGFVIAAGENPGRWVWDRFMTEGGGIGRAAALYESVFGVNPITSAKTGATVDPYEWLKACAGHYTKTDVVLGEDQQGSPRNFVGGPGKNGQGGGFKFAPSALESKKGAGLKAAGPGKAMAKPVAPKPMLKKQKAA